MQQDRYIITWMDRDGNWDEITAKTISDARFLFLLVDEDVQFACLSDRITGNVLEQIG